jgi:hypothetical protein
MAFSAGQSVSHKPLAALFDFLVGEGFNRMLPHLPLCRRNSNVRTGVNDAFASLFVQSCQPFLLVPGFAHCAS